MNCNSIADDIFDEYIEYIEYDDNDDIDDLEDSKENRTNNTDVVGQRVSKEQYSRMDQFHKENCEALVEGTVSDQLWDDLTTDLNEMGPSVQSVQEWKRKWTLRKYYHKRRLLKGSSSKNVSADKPPQSKADKPSQSKADKPSQSIADKPSQSSHSVEESSGGHSEFEIVVLKKLDKILNKLNQVIETQSSKME
ncbi:uncharacterized protein LOC119082830 isoform X2 [Bradysia coprophila]|uniref:uncharacterized protein LOC119071665 n=1 Tax=Bradysia coprophila TaxID=38358 RepID=UPI00187D7B86|nr:uncharacterized protein LOC119071665 [Bradysia coprophila]XP_037032540.1 uncharacterized protein LOC119071665 [Bradysia coprophila]XP_037048381.1 uncharacterized protein LOC119082830 isoform X2 [Bradysia coprophila]